MIKNGIFQQNVYLNVYKMVNRKAKACSSIYFKGNCVLKFPNFYWETQIWGFEDRIFSVCHLPILAWVDQICFQCGLRAKKSLPFSLPFFLRTKQIIFSEFFILFINSNA